MSKESVYYPSYQLRTEGVGHRTDIVMFMKSEPWYVTEFPLFGATATQKVAVEWASHKTPPVMWVKHEKPVDPDIWGFCDPECVYRQFYPYAMSVATFQCLGENKPRQVKVYFCIMELHEGKHHAKTRGPFVLPLNSSGQPEIVLRPLVRAR